MAAKTAIKEPKRSSALVRRETFASYCFLLPSLIFFLGFVIYPMVLCVVTSFFDSTMNRADIFVGLANYKELFTDPIFLGALKNTFIIVVVSVPVTCAFSLWVSSAIVDLPEWATSLFRCVFYLPVKKGQKLAGTRIIPLVIEQEKMDAMQAAAGSEPILNVLPFHPKKFAVITTGSEVFKGRIEDRFTPVLVGKLAEYGCEMTYHKTCDDDPAGITAAILEAKAAGCELIFTTGGMSVDPDDRTPLAIKNTGAEIITYGAPVLPGAMFLVSYLDGVPVCGLPGCVMYAKRTIFDLLLPRLLADDPITAEDIARLGEGGLCLGCAECHWPNCGFGHC